MNDWNLMLFKEIVEFPPKVKLEKGQMYSFIPMEDIDGINKYVSPKNEKEWKGTGGAKFEDGDTLFARITPCLQNGKISQAKNLKEGKGFGSTEYFIFRGLDQISDSDYIYYLAQTTEFRKYAIGSMVGASGRQRADAKYIGNYEVRLPPLDIQKRIAAILSSYDDLIENNTRRIKLLEELALRTYEEWFVKFRINGVQLVINEDSGLPEGWEVKKIENCCNVSGGGTPSRAIAEYWEDGDLPWFSPTDLSKSNSLFQLKSSEKINSLGLSKSSAKMLNPNSFMMTSRATIGLFGIVDKPFSTNQGFINITPLKIFHKEFLLYNLIRRTEEIKGHASGTTFLEISKSKFKMLEMIWPKDNVLVSFNSFVLPLHEMIRNLTYKNNSLKEARDILLPRLMSGEIVVKNAQEEKSERVVEKEVCNQ